MSNGGRATSANPTSNWTAEKNKTFENGLAMFDGDRGEPEQWRKIAEMVGGGTTEEEVKRQYEILREDIDRIESGKIPIPKYKKNSIKTEEEPRLKNLKL